MPIQMFAQRSVGMRAHAYVHLLTTSDKKKNWNINIDNDNANNIYIYVCVCTRACDRKFMYSFLGWLIGYRLYRLIGGLVDLQIDGWVQIEVSEREFKMERRDSNIGSS